MRGSAWCQEGSSAGGGVGALPPWCMASYPALLAALVHGMVRGGCPGETDGRRHPAPVSPPCDLVGACWQCRRPLQRLPSQPDPHSGSDHTVDPYMDPLFSSCLRGESRLLHVTLQHASI